MLRRLSSVAAVLTVALLASSAHSQTAAPQGAVTSDQLAAVKARVDAARAANAAQIQARKDAVVAAQQAHEQARLAAVSSECEASRPKRVADAQSTARAWAALVARISPKMKAIRAACVAKDTTGTRVERERDGNGVIVRTRQVGAYDDIVCKGALPRGISKDDAHTALYFDQYTSTRIDDDTSLDDDRCASADAAAGLPALNVTYGDGTGIGKLLAWSSSAPPPAASPAVKP